MNNQQRAELPPSRSIHPSIPTPPSASHHCLCLALVPASFHPNPACNLTTGVTIYGKRVDLTYKEAFMSLASGPGARKGASGMAHCGPEAHATHTYSH